MSANVEWGIPFTIQSAYGDLTLNDDTNPLGLFLLDQAGCAMGRDLRVTADPLPQADGENLHRSFTDGYQVRLTIQMWASRTDMACDEQLRLMTEELMLHLNSMENDAGRVFWTPTGLGDQRLLDEARVVALPRPSNGPPVSFDITWESPFPYVIDYTQKTEGLVSGVPEYLSNDGNVEMKPVMKVYGPSSAFTIWNSTVGQQLVYDSTQPGASAIAAGHYIEFDFFRETAWLDGNVARREAGIDVLASDFWALVPGVNFVEITGATADVLWNDANA